MLLWFKALHLISMVAWFAGLFYMFRLFVYHSENQDSREISTLLKKMSYRLFYYITTPALVGTLAFGFGMLHLNISYLYLGWIQAKLALVALLVVYHIYVGYVLARFRADDVFLSSRACRILNEVPTPILILVILLAVLRPGIFG